MDLTSVKPITDADLLRFGAQERWIEVIDGTLVEMSPNGFRHQIISGNVYSILRAFVLDQHLGYVLPDGLICVLRRDPVLGIRDSRIPDVAFIRLGRLPADFDLNLPFPGAPDLAVEIKSPGEDAATLNQKLTDYFTAGAVQVWILYPADASVHQYERNEHDGALFRLAHVCTGDQPLNVSALFPGLVVTARDFFAWPD